MNKMISIIIPIYNQASKIGDCLQSLLDQSYTNWELIVVNDGSTDEIEKVKATWEDKFSSHNYQFFSKTNEGSNPTRNFGAAKATGDFLLFCDADMVLNQDFLEKMVKTLENNPSASFAYCSFYYGVKLFKLFPYDQDRLKKMPYIHTTSLIRREHFPGFDNSIYRLQDWDLWLTMLSQGHTGVWIDEPLFKVKTNGHISTWLPKFAYTLLPFLPTVRKYNSSLAIIKKKHGLV